MRCAAAMEFDDRRAARTTACTPGSPAGATRSRSRESAGSPTRCWIARSRSSARRGSGGNARRPRPRRRSSGCGRPRRELEARAFHDARRSRAPRSRASPQRRGTRADARRGPGRLRARRGGAQAPRGARARRGPLRDVAARAGLRGAPDRRRGAGGRGGAGGRRGAGGRGGEVPDRRDRRIALGSAGSATEGRVVAFEGDWAQMEVHGKRLRVRRERARAGPGREPRTEGRDAGPTTSAPRHGRPPTRRGTSRAPRPRSTSSASAWRKRSTQPRRPSTRPSSPARSRLRVVHGHGTGRLRDGLREHFRAHGSVESLRAADAREGGNGATILELR